MNNSYNQRLFKSGIRKWIHLARFKWVNSIVLKYNYKTNVIMELGCFDGKILDYLPTPPLKYFGFDAGWEGGLDSAKSKYCDYQDYHFRYCKSPSDLDDFHEKINLFISLETFEHLPAKDIDSYLEAIERNATDDCLLLISVPNEKGIFFLVKYFFKLFIGNSEKYSFKEILWATLGKCHKINRREHKGFDWEKLEADISKRFKIIEIQGVNSSWLPIKLNPTIGLIFTKYN